MKATEQYFSVVLFIMLYKVILTFESVDEILKCDFSNESYWPVLHCGAIIQYWTCKTKVIEINFFKKVNSVLNNLQRMIEDALTTRCYKKI